MPPPPAPPSAKRVLGVDPGLKRTGLAVSDALGLSVRTVEVFTAKSRADAVTRIADAAAALEVEAVAIGHPVMPQSEDEGPMARRARGLAEGVAAAVAVPVFLVDERNSSKDAAAWLAASGAKKKTRQTMLDAAAAAVIVRRFLDGGGSLVPR